MLEDLTGVIEVVAYPDAWGKYSDIIQNDAKVLLHGKVNIRDEERKIILGSVTPLSKIPYLEIKISNDTSMVKLVSMRSILQEFLEILL